MLTLIQKIIVVLTLFFMSTLSFANDQKPPLDAVAYPCENGSILTYFKRPTVITSACPVPYGKYTIEGGIQYNDYINNGKGFTYPQSKVRVGLPWRSELSIVLPSEISNSAIKSTGLSSTVLALKHNMAYGEHWNSAVRAVYIPASGSAHYGTANNGYMLNGILAYKLNNINITGMISVSSLSTSDSNGGKQYTAYSPDVSIGWFVLDWLQLYAEVYGQSRTAPKQGAGFNLDTGLLFLKTKYIAADIEIGQQLSGRLGNFNTYYGAGISFMF